MRAWTDGVEVANTILTLKSEAPKATETFTILVYDGSLIATVTTTGWDFMYKSILQFNYYR